MNLVFLYDTNNITELNQLPKDEIAEVCARHFLEIEYISDAPPPIDLRQQIELAIPKDCYRLLRISRIYQKQNQDSVQHSKIDLAPPTPESLFSEIWSKMGYEPDSSVQKDFQILLAEAQHDLDQKQG